jgi:uncharacterized membrane protein YphA (DoxX/SURF4 family)
MRWTTQAFLILLRLAIGWHFFFEGIDKIQSVRLGPSETNRPWTSADYLRQSRGPWRTWFRSLAPDSDEDLLAQLSLPKDQSAGSVSQLPAALDARWQNYFDRFATQYGLDATQLQRTKQELAAARARTHDWLAHGKKKVLKSFPSGIVEVEENTQERVRDLRRQLDEVARMEDAEFPAFGKDVRRQALRQAIAESRRLRDDLQSDLHAQTSAMRTALENCLTDRQKALGPVPEPRQSSPIVWIDPVIMWSLTVIGACLLLGIASRCAALAGAVFLFLLYQALPPFPALAENLRAEGHYLFVNKDLIEMLALMVLATVPSGRWLGLDGLFHALFRRRSA